MTIFSNNDFTMEFKDINDVMENLYNSYKYNENLQDWKGVVDVLQREKKKIKSICDNPSRLTADDKIQIEKLIIKYKEILLNNKIFMLVYRDEILEKIDSVILQYSKKLMPEISQQQDIRKWTARKIHPAPDDKPPTISPAPDDKPPNIVLEITELERTNIDADDKRYQIIIENDLTESDLEDDFICSLYDIEYIPKNKNVV